MNVEIVEWKTHQVIRNRHNIGTVYRHAFADYPYFTPEHVAITFIEETLPQHARRPGFRCVVARNIDYDIVLGFAYGYSGAPGQWWREIVAKALPTDVAAHWMQDYFEFVELAVSPSAQGQGIGGRIYDLLFAGVTHPRALLSTHTAETPARHMYDRRGWCVLRDDFLFPGASEPFVIMGLKLKEEKG